MSGQVPAPGPLAGVTGWCTHPASLPGAERIGGTKNPDTARITALRPDVVLANEEENRPGVGNVYADHPERYPRVGLEELRGCGARPA
jgi:ABC-type Fe3+-hydroxamate transport system substrate-binding protein